MTPCVFCEILAGRSPATFVHRDDAAAAFLDIQPIAPGHTLVVPVVHAERVGELDPADWARVAVVAQGVGAALRASGLRCDDVFWFVADGRDAGQDVPHVHVHLVPRWRGDGLGLRLPKGYGARPARDELDAVGLRIRRALAVT